MPNIIKEEICLDSGGTLKEMDQEEFMRLAKEFADLVYEFTTKNEMGAVGVIMALASEPPAGGIYRASIIHAQPCHYSPCIAVLCNDMNRLYLMGRGEEGKN